MHHLLQNVVNELEAIVVALNATIPTDTAFSIGPGNWTFPGVSRIELVEVVDELSALIIERGMDVLGEHESRIADYIPRLVFLRTNTVPNIHGSSATGVPTFMITIEGLRKAVSPALEIDSEAVTKTAASLSRLKSRTNSLETRLNDIEPRSTKLVDMVARIEDAYQAADQLPKDLEQLIQDRAEVAELLYEARLNYEATLKARKNSETLVSELSASAADAESVLKKCQTAYTAATSQGLAAAFTKRSKALDTSMWIWVVGFTAALALGAYSGSQRFHELSELMKNPNVSVGATWLNLLLALLSIGAPIWFGWLAAKQIGQRFRLSEDYAFKAAVSSAYEGYRLEAARFGDDMEARLLSSALTRFDEQPLRLVERESHGSPWHEFATSDTFKNAVNLVPGFAEKAIAAAKDALGAVKPGDINFKNTAIESQTSEVKSASQ